MKNQTTKVLYPKAGFPTKNPNGGKSGGKRTTIVKSLPKVGKSK